MTDAGSTAFAAILLVRCYHTYYRDERWLPGHDAAVREPLLLIPRQRGCQPASVPVVYSRPPAHTACRYAHTTLTRPTPLPADAAAVLYACSAASRLTRHCATGVTAGTVSYG